MTATLTAILGVLIQVHRRAAGWSQGELARAAGLHPMALSKIERGIQGDLGIETLARIAAAYPDRIALPSLLETACRIHERVNAGPGEGELRGPALMLAVCAQPFSVELAP